MVVTSGFIFSDNMQDLIIDGTTNFKLNLEKVCHSDFPVQTLEFWNIYFTDELFHFLLKTLSRKNNIGELLFLNCIIDPKVLLTHDLTIVAEQPFAVKFYIYLGNCVLSTGHHMLAQADTLFQKKLFKAAKNKNNQGFHCLARAKYTVECAQLARALQAFNEAMQLLGMQNFESALIKFDIFLNGISKDHFFYKTPQYKAKILQVYAELIDIFTLKNDPAKVKRYSRLYFEAYKEITNPSKSEKRAHDLVCSRVKSYFKLSHFHRCSISPISFLHRIGTRAEKMSELEIKLHRDKQPCNPNIWPMKVGIIGRRK